MTNKEAMTWIWKDVSIDVGKSKDITKTEMALKMAYEALGVIDQIRWERDIAIEQLRELGYELGAKPKYRWHDLREDPEDLPKGTNDVLIWDDGDAEIGYLSDTVNHGVHKRIWYVWNPYAEEDEKYCRAMNVVAWKEIEPFEEV